MPGREITLVCPDCQSPVQADPDLAGHVVRCEPCFRLYLRRAEIGFLDEYAAFGSVRRRVVAEHAARGLVMASPEERKALIVTVFEQFLHAATDLIALYHAIKNRHERSLIETFLGFELDAARARDFFADLEELSEAELLARLGLPEPEQISALFPEWRDREIADAAAALWRAMNRLKRAAGGLLLSERALLEAHRQLGRMRPLVNRATWLDDVSLAPDQVGAMILDYRHRRLAFDTFSIDESGLSDMLNVIDLATGAAGDLAYVCRLLHREDGRLPRLPPGK